MPDKKMYAITRGFNVLVTKKWDKPFGQSVSYDVSTNQGGEKTLYEVRFEPVDSPISKDQLPKNVAFDWLVSKGILVEIIPEEVPELELEEVAEDD